MSNERCDCEDWKPGTKAIDAPIVLQSIRSGGAYRYEGKPWKYCPWCNSALKDICPTCKTAYAPGTIHSCAGAPADAPPVVPMFELTGHGTQVCDGGTLIWSTGTVHSWPGDLDWDFPRGIVIPGDPGWEQFCT